MPGAAHHALLDVPRIRPHLQHFEIVIRFQHQAIGIAQMNFHQFRQIAEIGDDRYFHAVRAKVNPRGSTASCGIEIGETSISPTINRCPARMCSTRSRRLCDTFRQDAQDFGVRRFGQVHGGAPLAQHLRQRADVIAMFVGDDDAVEPVDSRPTAARRRSVSFLPSPASTSRRVCSVSSNVQLPELPEARIVMRRLIASPGSRPVESHARIQAQMRDASAGPTNDQNGSAGVNRQHALSRTSQLETWLTGQQFSRGVESRSNCRAR